MTNLHLSAYLEVPLSTIDQFPEHQGEEAARLAISLIEGEGERGEKRLLIEPKLIARDSTIGHTGQK